jgi:hypothetical protein
MLSAKTARCLALLLTLGFSRLAAQGDMGGMMMSGPGDEMMMGDTMDAGRHLRMTPHWDERSGDRARADSLADVARNALARYTDVKLAEADGYHMFAPKVRKQGVYHYSNRANAFHARSEFDVTRPSALLYQPQRDGSLRLIGAMYTAPPDFSLDQLDERLPLSIAQWHQHTSICLPPGSVARRGAAAMDRMNMDSRFGPRGSISTREECDAANGVFLPRMFGWMVHVNMFLSPEQTWVHKG